tara:strand:- start:1244 stop:1915 length:672 start_codon:yes stop_codon:yes gene_type:complete
MISGPSFAEILTGFRKPSTNDEGKEDEVKQKGEQENKLLTPREKIELLLKNFNLKREDVLGDGRCMWRCVIQYFHNDPFIVEKLKNDKSYETKHYIYYIRLLILKDWYNILKKESIEEQNKLAHIADETHHCYDDDGNLNVEQTILKWVLYNIVDDRDENDSKIWADTLMAYAFAYVTKQNLIVMYINEEGEMTKHEIYKCNSKDTIYLLNSYNKHWDKLVPI